MTPDDLLNVKCETAEVEQRGVRTRGYQRSTSLVSIASPRATEPNTRTSRKPRWDAAARICPRAARRDPRSGGRSCCCSLSPHTLGEPRKQPVRSFPACAWVRQTGSTATLCDQMRTDGSNIASPTSVYNPVHGSPTTGIKTAGGAGGARTHDRRIMSPLL
jgi:hypothetical protein